MILAILLQTLCQTESTTLGRDKPLLMVLWDDMSGHIYAVAIGDNVEMAVHCRSDTAENVETSGILSFLDTTQIGCINIGKLCDIPSVHTALHPKALDFCSDSLPFVFAIWAIPEDASPAMTLIHTTKNRPHYNRRVALVIFVEECSDNLAVLLLHFKRDYS